jgi:hypothetical protein
VGSRVGSLDVGWSEEESEEVSVAVSPPSSSLQPARAVSAMTVAAAVSRIFMVVRR